MVSLRDHSDKLVFVSVRLKNAVIANQRARWCGNPPVERDQVTITTKNRNDSNAPGHFSVHFPSIWGIATPVCELARNDSINSANAN